MKLIAFTGKAGSGKDTAAGFAIEHLRRAGHNPKKLAFATPIKEMVRVLLQYAFPTDHISMEEVDLLKQTEHVYPLANIKVNVRRMLQTLGTEWGRQCVDENLWLKLADQHMADYPDVFWVISDLRFENEAEFVRRRGGIVIHVERDGAGAGDHASEAGVKFEPDDVLLTNNMWLEELSDLVKVVLEAKGVI